MILHLASFTWKEGVTDAQVEAVTAALLTLPDRIPELRSYVVGPNLHLRPGGRDYAVAAILDDAAGLDAYLDHPAHVAAVEEHIAPLIAERAAVQLPLADGRLERGA